MLKYSNNAMMLHSIKVGKIFRRNYREIVFVFIAFALMALSAYFFIGRMLQEHLLSGTEEIMYTAGANVRAGLSEAETTLLNSYYIVQGMLERDADRQEILDYLNTTTEWMRRRAQGGLLNFYGIYGYINGEMYDSIGLNPGSDFVPQRRPWYQAAVRSGNTVAYTAPYEDQRTGEIIVSAVQSVNGKDGDITGILVIDIDVKWLQEYIGSLALAEGGYGILLSQNMTLMAHPDSAFLGRQLQELGSGYNEVARILRSGEDVFALRMTDSGGSPVIVFFSRIFNGWYMGIITPYSEFYRDLNLSAAILILLGVILSLSLCVILLRLSAAKVRADEDNKSKSSFLANLSHEIRTPMNAITGMAELMLRGELNDEARSYAQDIKHAGSNLLSIINDLLDFSKIEAGKLEIIPVRYKLSSLINDVVNIVRMRLMEKSVRFYTNIDGKIPDALLGDEVRLRQIILNLMSNAVKYTEKGHISLSVAVYKQEHGQVWLKIAVSDTGKGIRQEDLGKLFNDFVQVDTRKNRSIEGTGLGLAITKRLCLLMGGDVGVQSDYGEGSVFTAILPQNIASTEPFAAVHDAAKKKVLVYEGRAIYAKSVCWSLDNMGVPYTMAETMGDFAEAVLREEWFYIFTGYGLYEKIRPIMDRPDDTFPGGKKPPLALMVEWGTEDQIPGIHFMPLPIQSLAIANILNGNMDNKGYSENSAFYGVIRFTIPHARLLVVDDIATNLKVAEGLLAPYQATVDVCQSGAEAVDLAKKREYDLIFMDHMMPDMDGIETTAAIRALPGERFKTLPIVALTANAVVGMREMFIEKDFNDFLAKTIDVSKMDEILARWIPEEKKEVVSDQWVVGSEDRGSKNDSHYPLIIPGVDTAKGIMMTGGTLNAYKQVLSMFRKDAQERMPLLQNMPSVDILPSFITQVHALKSAAASLGAAEVSAQAARLESAGKAKDMVFIQKNLNNFTERLAELINHIGDALEEDAVAVALMDKEGEEQPFADISVYVPLLQELAVALREQKADDIDHVLENLMQQTLDAKSKETLNQISDEVLMAEYGKAGEIVSSLLEGEEKWQLK
jgi:signal transduction histidine kinase/HPt (histidine-containing phosphotransfer) domain-containing protein/ActR/RegA family two-component response regulator